MTLEDTLKYTPRPRGFASVFGSVSRDKVRKQSLAVEEIPDMERFTDAVTDVLRGKTTSFSRFDLGEVRGNLSTRHDMVCALIPTQSKKDREAGKVSVGYIIFTPSDGDETKLSTPNFRKKILAQKRTNAKETKKRWPNAKFSRDQSTSLAFLTEHIEKPIAVLGYSWSPKGEALAVFCPEGKSPDWAIGNFRNVIVRAA